MACEETHVVKTFECPYWPAFTECDDVMLRLRDVQLTDDNTGYLRARVSNIYDQPSTRQRHVTFTFLTEDVDQDVALYGCDIVEVSSGNMFSAGVYEILKTELNAKCGNPMEYDGIDPNEPDADVPCDAFILCDANCDLWFKCRGVWCGPVRTNYNAALDCEGLTESATTTS